MTYERLFYLKYKRQVSTYELIRRFPQEVGRVSEVALLDVPVETLKKIIREEKVLKKLMRLKKRFIS